jgi:hypothetical protein
MIDMWCCSVEIMYVKSWCFFARILPYTEVTYFEVSGIQLINILGIVLQLFKPLCHLANVFSSLKM